MSEYKPVTSLVNGEIIKDLLDLCNSEFTTVGVKRYAGARSECFFCCAQEHDNGMFEHSPDQCPVVKYKEIVEKHSRWIVKK